MTADTMCRVPPPDVLGPPLQILDMLDQEAEEDEVFQSESPVVRPVSSDANAALVAKAERYRGLLEGAAQSDAVVRKKWEDWEEHIVQLMWSNVSGPPSVCFWAALTRPCATGGTRGGRAVLDRFIDVHQGSFPWREPDANPRAPTACAPRIPG